MADGIQTALISVSDKTGIVSFARELAAHKISIFSTGGTLKTLQAAGISAQSLAELTHFPELLGGRVKTLHPGVFAGILARRNNPSDMETLTEHNLQLIDLVVVNLYPFEEIVGKPEVAPEQIIEHIDIGGVSLVRAAAKNFSDVTVVIDPGDYDRVAEELRATGGNISLETRRSLATKVFQRTSHYDQCIARFYESLGGTPEQAAEVPFPPQLSLQYLKEQDLRYGENPHQQAALYREHDIRETSVVTARQLHGKELSYNNIADLETALEMVRDFDAPTVVILKHANPCGVASAERLVEAYRLARECDPVSAFGGIIGLNRTVDEATAAEIASTFIEAVIAPDYEENARSLLAKKKNIRLLATGPFSQKYPGWSARSIVGGILIQTRDLTALRPDDLKIVTEAEPTPDDIQGMLFAWKVVKWVKSNAIVYTTKNYTVGIGAGQMSRIDSASFGMKKALKSVQGTYMASDAFFPFSDSIDIAARAGVRAIIQPGGSIRDQEVIDAANQHGLIMAFTNVRHFRH
jgi:phosphoribosylaminoimidazolecarboxamide formyltransferase/IMP cyclohydrolase